MLERQVEDGKPLLAVIKTEILNWDSKASHPWVAVLDLQYEGHENGLPEEEDYNFLDKIEDEIMEELKDFEGYLNIGRETADNSRVIYFACKDFRKPSKVFYEIEQKYHDKYEVNFDIFKDKYWRSFNRFIVH